MKNPSKERADEVKSLLLPGPGSTRIHDATPLAVSAAQVSSSVGSFRGMFCAPSAQLWNSK
jgi:hypothetical protein